MIQRLSPYLFLSEAEKFFSAAKSVYKPPVTVSEKLRCSAPFVAYFLVGRSIELSLKAFLFARGEKINCLKHEYGHNLSKLIFESRRRKLGREVKLNRNQLAAVKLLSAPYSKKLLEYSEVGPYRLPHYWVVCEVTLDLLKGLRSYCYKATFNKELPISQIRKIRIV